MCGCDEAGAVVDVRGLPCAIRRAAVFDQFDACGPGEAFVIVCDHDPAPLRSHLESRAVAGCAFDVLEAGPAAWRVRVVRR